MLGGDTFPFVERYDQVFVVRHGIPDIIGRKIPLNIFTDSEILFQLIMGSSSVILNNRLIVYVSASKEAYDTGEISYIYCIFWRTISLPS